MEQVNKSCIATIRIHEETSKRAEYIEYERNSAIIELTSDSIFYPQNDNNGEHAPYNLDISIQNHQLSVDVHDINNNHIQHFILSLRPYRKLIKDYFIIVESYEKARLEGNQVRLQPIDMARRGIHDEGAELLQERLKDKIRLNHKTARRIFTLICVLHIGKTRVKYL